MSTRCGESCSADKPSPSDLTTAYLDAAGRAVEFTTVSDLTSSTALAPGVYANSSKGPLLLTGAMTLDGQNDPNAVFIFQTDSTLITGSGSVVNLIEWGVRVQHLLADR